MGGQDQNYDHLGDIWFYNSRKGSIDKFQQEENNSSLLKFVSDGN